MSGNDSGSWQISGSTLKWMAKGALEAQNMKKHDM